MFIGDYSTLHIGKLDFNWKYYVPPFVIFLFDENDFYSIKDDTEDYYEDRGYRSTCEKCLNVLDSHGYNLDFFADVYSTFHDEVNGMFKGDILLRYYIELLGSEDKTVIEGLINEYEINYPIQSKKKDLLDFIKFIKLIINSKKNKRKDHPNINFLAKISDQDFNELKNIDLSNLDDVGDFLFPKSGFFPPSINKVSLLFYEDYFLNYTEIIYLMYIRLIMEALPKKQKVSLSLTELSDNDDEAKYIYERITTTLSRKAQLYNMFFKAFSKKHEDLREKWAKDKSRELLDQLEIVDDNNEKGKILEELFSIIFESHPEFHVIEKRYKTEDEEIDLTIKNNASKPFWLNLSSPMIFVECKNWQKPVGSSEIRDFEMKLQNHQNLVKIGIFVAPGGFSSACDKSLSRSSREPYSIILIDREKLDRFTNSQLSILEWLEEIICHPI